MLLLIDQSDQHVFYKHLDFKITEEINNTTNYLDLHIHRTHKKIQLGIYRKPTQTDTPTTHFNTSLQDKSFI